MPVVIFFTCLDFEQKSSVMDGHYQKPASIVIEDGYILYNFLSLELIINESSFAYMRTNTIRNSIIFFDNN